MILRPIILALVSASISAVSQAQLYGEAQLHALDLRVVTSESGFLNEDYTTTDGSSIPINDLTFAGVNTFASSLGFAEAFRIGAHSRAEIVDPQYLASTSAATVTSANWNGVPDYVKSMVITWRIRGTMQLDPAVPAGQAWLNFSLYGQERDETFEVILRNDLLSHAPKKIVNLRGESTEVPYDGSLVEIDETFVRVIHNPGLSRPWSFSNYGSIILHAESHSLGGWVGEEGRMRADANFLDATWSFVALDGEGNPVPVPEPLSAIILGLGLAATFSRRLTKHSQG